MPPLAMASDASSTSDDVPIVQVPIDSTFSDGDRDAWPTDARYQKADPGIYLEKLAKMWMKQTGKLRPGQTHVFHSYLMSISMFVWEALLKFCVYYPPWHISQCHGCCLCGHYFLNLFLPSPAMIHCTQSEAAWITQTSPTLQPL